MQPPAVALGGIGVEVIVVSQAAHAAAPYVTTSEYAAADFATSFPSADVGNDSDGDAPYDPLGLTTGPIGLAFDSAGYLWVGDLASGGLYRFPPAGGPADSATFVSQLSAGISDIAFSPDRRMYIANQSEGTILEVSPTTGAILRTVTAAVQCPTGMAFDPLSGDLFVSQGILRGAHRPHRGSGADNPTIVNYTVGTSTVDGVAFTPDGTLYAVDGPRGPDTTLQTFEGTLSDEPGALLSTVATVPYGDGLTFSKPVGTFRAPVRLREPQRWGGTRVDLTGATGPLNIMTGGTRGDFMTTGPDGCLYPTQSESVVKITFTDGFCDGMPTLVPPSPPPGSGVNSSTNSGGSNGGNGGTFTLGTNPSSSLASFSGGRRRRSR